MTDREILGKYVDLDKSCLANIENKQVIDMLYKYIDTFSLGDVIGTCPNIEVEIDITDKSPFFIRLYHVKEEDKKILDKEMKRIMLLRNIKRSLLAYSSPVMLISSKVTKDKRAVTNVRHLDVRIAKSNLAYPLLKDTFSVLCSSRCEVSSVLDLKDAFHSLRCLENSKRYCGILPYLVVLHIWIKECYEIKYIMINLAIIYNTILDYIQRRKYCEAILCNFIMFW